METVNFTGSLADLDLTLEPELYYYTTGLITTDSLVDHTSLQSQLYHFLLPCPVNWFSFNSQLTSLQLQARPTSI